MNKFNKRELASILDVSERTLTEWQVKGLPIASVAAKIGEANEYELQAVARWLATSLKAREGMGAADDGGETFSNARVRKERAAADLLELERAELTGRLVDAEEVRRAAFALARQAMDNMLAIPDRVSAMLAAESDPARTHDLLTLELRRVCDVLATPR